jgi:predicted dienelactone hydrolase
VFLAVSALIPVLATAAEKPMTIAGLSVSVWSRETSGGTPQPVIIFSHGFGGCATQSRFLMEAFADAGYLVIAPNHRDAGCSGTGRAGRPGSRQPEAPFQQAAAWNDMTYRDRADDVRRLIESLRTDERFRSRVDFDRLALAGHSLGGYTVLGLAGAWPSWKLSGLKAVLALSPYSQPFDKQHTLAGVSVPIMYQGGTRDLGITPTLHKSQGAYDLTPAPKFYVEFQGAGHFAWTNLSTVAHDAIVAYSLAFMNHYVRGNAPGVLKDPPPADVAVYRYDSEFGTGGASTVASHHGARARP